MRKAKSYRLPELTLRQVEAIAAKTGMTYTQVLIAAIDRMAKQEKVK